MIMWARLRTAEAMRADAVSAAQSAASARLSAAHDAASRAIAGDVPPAKRLSRGVNCAAARACLAGTASDSDAAMIEAEARVRAEDPTGLAEQIVMRADAFRLVAARIAEFRRIWRARLAEAEDPDAAERILRTAVAEIAALAAQPPDPSARPEQT